MQCSDSEYEYIESETDNSIEEEEITAIEDNAFRSEYMPNMKAGESF